MPDEKMISWPILSAVCPMCESSCGPTGWEHLAITWEKDGSSRLIKQYWHKKCLKHFWKKKYHITYYPDGNFVIKKDKEDK